MLENRIARFLGADAADNSNASTLTNSNNTPRPANAAPGNWPIMSQADLYRLAFEQARQEAERKRWSNNRIRRFFE